MRAAPVKPVQSGPASGIPPADPLWKGHLQGFAESAIVRIVHLHRAGDHQSTLFN